MRKKLANFDKYLDKFIGIFIPGIIVLLPVVFTLYVLNVHQYISIPFRLDTFYRYTLGLLISIYFYKLVMKKASFTKSDIFICLFMFFTVLSTFTAYNKTVALYGYYNRYEGMFTLLFYGFLYLDCKLLPEKKHITKYIIIILSAGIIQFICSILQFAGLFEKVIFMYTGEYIIGLTENANFLGSMVCLTTIISIAYFLFIKKHYIFMLISFIISYITLLLANCTGPFITTVFVFVIMVIYLIVKKKINVKRTIIITLLMIALYPAVLYHNNQIGEDIKLTFNLVHNIFVKDKKDKIEVENFDDNDFLALGNQRIRIWKNVIVNSAKKPILGYGPDNMGLLYKAMDGEKFTADKAHNIYLNILYSSGIFAMLSFIVWNIQCIRLGFKNGKDEVMVLCFGVLAYAIQGIMNINVIEVTPYFYFAMGLMMWLVKEKKFSLKD